MILFSMKGGLLKWWKCTPDSSLGQDGAHLGPVGPGWAPCWPLEPCYQGHQFPYKFWGHLSWNMPHRPTSLVSAHDPDWQLRIIKWVSGVYRLIKGENNFSFISFKVNTNSYCINHLWNGPWDSLNNSSQHICPWTLNRHLATDILKCMLLNSSCESTINDFKDQVSISSGNGLVHYYVTHAKSKGDNAAISRKQMCRVCIYSTDVTYVIYTQSPIYGELSLIQT